MVRQMRGVSANGGSLPNQTVRPLHTCIDVMGRHAARYVVTGLMILSGLLVVQLAAQENAQKRAASLRAQLVETQARQAELQTRLQQLEEDLKPDNIEHRLAGVGSTHPEELREARRRQLEIEKKGVQSQLEILAASRAHLETAIASADAQSYQQSAGVGPNIAQAGPNSATPVTQGLHRTRTHRQRKRRSHRRLQT